MSTRQPFQNSGWFAIHNAVFDDVMPRLSGAAWRVLCVAIRLTLGWRDPDSDDPRDRKEWDVISYSQFMEKSGVKSSSTIKIALDELIDLGCLIRKPAGTVPGTGATLYAYKLNLEFELDDAPEGDQGESEPKIEAGQARFDNRSGPASKIEVDPLRKSKRQNKTKPIKEGNGDAGFCETCFELLTQAGYDQNTAQELARAGHRLWPEQDACKMMVWWEKDTREAERRGAATNRLGLLRYKIEQGAIPPKWGGDKQKARGPKGNGWDVCPKCWTRPCICDELVQEEKPTRPTEKPGEPGPGLE